VEKTKVRVKFLSTMREAAGQDDNFVVIGENSTVADLLKLISATYNRNVAALLFEEGRATVRSDTLVLVNDVEISVLEGDGTRLVEGDEISLMPIAHGG
jgi:molybdopterin converting factor small subunit